VAVLGSVLSSSYASAIAPALGGLGASAATLAGDSVGGATAVAAQTGGNAGRALLEAAHTAFTSSMGAALLIGAGVAAAGAVVTLVFLPAHASDPVGSMPDGSAPTESQAKEVGAAVQDPAVAWTP
jgi:hypothetical protein